MLMVMLLALLAVGVLAELGMILPLPWHLRKVGAGAALVATSLASGMLVARWPGVGSAVLLGLGLYRVCNDVRMVYGRLSQQYLGRITRRTTFALWILQAGAAGIWIGWLHWRIGAPAVWATIAALQMVVASVLFVTTIRRLRRTAWPERLPHLSDSELPTVTVAIPARNETEDLEICLESVIASDYPKLEVLVLDDCSQTKRTPEIIRSFAHAGIRFLQGEQPNNSWFPKNRAYDQLAAEASGEYILFCGVDVHFSPGSIRQMVAALKAKKKAMMSLLPLRAERVGSRPALAQAMRYWWEIVPPRRLFNRPPVLSTCWIIETKALQAEGGFAAAQRSVVPEAYFARQLLRRDAYSFMRASQTLGITSNKPATEQRATAIRLRYPQLHRRLENVAAVTLFELAFLVLPFGMAIGGWWLHLGMFVEVSSSAASLLLVILCWLLAHATHVMRAPYALFAVPVMTLYDLFLLHVSMWRYEFATVEWKGRNICIPAMHVIARLPQLKD